MVDWSFSGIRWYFGGAIVFLIAFSLAISVNSVVSGCLAVFVLGAILGRLCFRMRRNMEYPLVVMVGAALFGVWIGSLFGHWFLFTVVFVIGVSVSFILHSKKIIETVEW